MNRSAFLELIQKASSITDQQTEELEKLAQTFPYCQTAHLLLAKSAYDKGSMLSTQRLRRAASYATDRQLLKRVIYTVPAEAPVFDETAVPEQATIVAETAAPETTISEPQKPEQAVIAETIVEDLADQAEAIVDKTIVDLAENTEAIVDVSIVNPSIDEHLIDREDTLTEPETIVSVGSEAEVTEPENDALTALQTITIEAEAAETLPEAEEENHYPYSSESELDSLLTISTLSSSFTDLLSQKPDITLQEAEEIFRLETIREEQAAANAAEMAITEAATIVPEKTTAIVEEPQSPVKADTNPEDAVVTYATDDLDRMFAEDALGYWMGSSRLGEGLQLKNEYTRPRPQSFHPELILEYTKTHELEKAIQTSRNLLSEQLDIIDQFLKLNPRLKTMANMKLKPEPQEDLSLKSSRIKKGMASENLANIFLKQGKTKKAIKIYEQLILKYPEKKSYFAEQIEKLQNVN